MSLKTQISNLTRHSFIYTISTFIQRTLGLIMMPIYTSAAYLSTQSEYGDLTLFYTFTAFMNIVYLYGMDSAFMRYYFLGKSPKRDIYTTAFAAVFSNAIIISILILISSSFTSNILFGSEDYAFHMKLAAAILFLDTFSNLPYLILRAEERSVAYSTIRIIRFLMELAFNIIFVVFYKFGFLGILYANALAALINIVILIPFQWPYLKGRWDLKTFKELSKFGLPMIPNGIAYLVVEVSDKYLMRLLLGKETLGLYAANYKFGTILLMLVIAFRAAWQPFFLKIAETVDAKRIYSRVLTYFTLMAVSIVIIVSYLIEDLVKIPLGTVTILGKNYWEGIHIIPIILTSYMFYGLYVNFTVGIYIRKKTQLMIIFTGVAAIINVASNFYLMPAYGIMGAAIATLLSYMIMAISIFIANQKIFPVEYEYHRLAVLILVLILMLFILYYFEPEFLTRLILILVTPIVFVLSGFFKKDELRAIQSIMKLK